MCNVSGRRLICFSIWFALSCTASAKAQTSAPSAAGNEQAPPVDEKSDSKKITELKPVVVTAEHRKEDIQKMSIAVTAISGDDARERGDTRLSEVITAAPSLQVQGSPQGGQIYIRGVGSNGDSNYIDPAVGLMIDGVYSGRAETVLSSMYDIDRVEILRGPQGTLYGRNSTGGTINVLTNEPESTFSGAVNTQLGNYGLRHLDAMLNLPINSWLSARVAVLREKHDGYFRNDGGAADLTGARLKLLAKPTDALTIGLTVDHYQTKGAGQTTVPRSGVTFWPTYPTGGLGSPWDVDALHPADYQNYTFNTYTLKINYDLGWANLTFLPSYARNDRYLTTNLITGIWAGNQLATTDWKETQRSGELRLSSPDDSAIKWVVGAYDYRSGNNLDNISVVSQQSYEVYKTDFISTSKAIYGQATFPLIDSWRLVAGYRYTKDSKKEIYGLRSLVGSWDSGIVSETTSDSASTWKLGVEQDLSRNSMLYATVSTGYKAGGWSTTAYPPVSYLPEKLTSFEVGSKSRFLDNRLQWNNAIYLYRYKDAQIQYATSEASPNPDDTSGGTVFAQFVANAKTGTNRGAESEFEWLVSSKDQLKISAAYMDAAYGKIVQPALSYLSNAPAANSPRWSGNVGYAHYWDLGNGDTLSAGLNERLTKGYWVTPQITMDHDWQGGYHRTDAHISYQPLNGRWSLTLWVKNVENKAVATMVFPLDRILITDPRTFGLNASVNF